MQCNLFTVKTHPYWFNVPLAVFYVEIKSHFPNAASYSQHISPKMGFRYCWKYISSLAEATSVLIDVIDVENVIAVNIDSNFYMSLIHFNVHKKREPFKTIHYIW